MSESRIESFRNSNNSSVLSSCKYNELSNLMSNIGNIRDKLILKILIETGITANELVNIKISDIDFGSKSLSINETNTKNKQSRSINLSFELISLIEQYLNLNNCDIFRDNLFKSRQSGSISVRRLEQIISNYKLSSGDKLSPRYIRNICQENDIGLKKTYSEIKTKYGIKTLSSKKIITKSQYEKLISIVENDSHKLIIDLFWETGLSSSELIGLKKSDFLSNQGLIVIRPEISKSNLPRVVFLSNVLNKKLLDFTKKLSVNNNIFSSQKSSQITPLRIRQIISKYSDNSGIGLIVTPQIIRNSHIYYSVQNGEPLNSISERLGITNLGKNSYTNLIFPENSGGDKST